MKKLIFLILLCCVSCKREPTTVIITETKYDTIVVNDTIYQYMTDSATHKKLISTQQNLVETRDSLLLYKYKIERIRYYNKIAANGNNIKFLRGWINRVIN